jgi:hypothetical protein
MMAVVALAALVAGGALHLANLDSAWLVGAHIGAGFRANEGCC